MTQFPDFSLLNMKTLPILFALATTFGATIGLPYSPLWYQVQVRERRDTNVVNSNDEKFSNYFRDHLFMMSAKLWHILTLL